MMKRAELEAILGTSQSAVTQKYGHLVPCLIDLYELGLTIKQMEAMFPVSRQWIRSRFKEKEIEFRSQGPRTLEQRQVDPDDVIRVLRRHKIKLEDLPSPGASSLKKRTSKKRKKRS